MYQPGDLLVLNNLMGGTLEGFSVGDFVLIEEAGESREHGVWYPVCRAGDTGVRGYAEHNNMTRYNNWNGETPFQSGRTVGKFKANKLRIVHGLIGLIGGPLREERYADRQYNRRIASRFMESLIEMLLLTEGRNVDVEIQIIDEEPGAETVTPMEVFTTIDNDTTHSETRHRHLVIAQELRESFYSRGISPELLRTIEHEIASEEEGGGE